MAQITTGLTSGGLTTHYQVSYDDSLAKADGSTRANALLAVCEADYNLMSGWFGGISLPFSLPVSVQIVPGNYAKAGWGPPITLQPGNGSAIDVVRYLLVSEVVEMFMLAQDKDWYGGNWQSGGNEGSAGEGLSRFLAGQFLIANALGVTEPGFALANSWMNSPREDFVNNVDPTDNAIDKKTGCAILFIYYLHIQLGFSIDSIVAAGAQQLSGVYKNLTGDSSDPFPYFKQMLDNAFPGTTSIPGSNPDNPYPLGSLSYWVVKNTFGRDEVNDRLAPPNNGLYTEDFWLVLDGFNKQTAGSATPTTPTLGFGGASIAFDAALGIDYEVPNNPYVPQRIRYPYNIQFTSAALGSFPGSGTLEEASNASINLVGTSFPATTVFEFVSGADPYFTNIQSNPNPNLENVPWLSQDLRVFTATPALNPSPVAGGPGFPSDSVAGAYSYIQQLVTYLNGAYGDPSGTDPFNTSSSILPGQQNAYTGDSSVTPYTILGFAKFNNYNFAVARVRLQGSEGVAGEAQNVKVFFRLWGTQTADTDYQPGSTYPSHLDSNNLPDWPLPASDSHTIPFFATGNSPNLTDPNNPEYGSNGINNQTIVIKQGDTQWAYFGCFLNVNDSSNIVNGSQIQALLPGTHHCLVAQIAYDEAPIVNSNGVVMSPDNSDKLAQRNLQVTTSDNPGAAATHRIPQTFDVRPSLPITPGQGRLLNYPDELMIDWGNTPVGSKANIYWPQVDASQVLQLASQIYGTHLLSAADANTIQCKVTDGITYVPIPASTGPSFAGLFTIDLPPTVIKGQEFNVVVRRITTRRVIDRQVPAPQMYAAVSKKRLGATPQSSATPQMYALASQKRSNAALPSAATASAAAVNIINWRYVVGTFQIKIPVSTKNLILPAEETTLAIMKWRLQAMPISNRWYPVLQRYIAYLSARVDGLGGNASGIPPSLGGAPIEGEHPGAEETVFTGKVCEVIYDCFGRLEGFVLNTCTEHHLFETCEGAIGDLVLRACKERLLLSVYVQREHKFQKEHKQHRIRKIVVRC